MSTIPVLTVPHKPRCNHCGGVLEHFEGESYCPSCLSFGLASQPEDDHVDLADRDDDDGLDLVDLGRA
jgi:hypothetical protein